MTECCGYTRYETKNSFRVSHAPQVCGQTIGKTKEICKTAPAYHIHETNTWVCGRHLRRTMLPECSVCISSMTPKDTQTLPCGHSFHPNCMSTWKTKNNGRLTCPLCRMSAYRPLPITPGVIKWNDDNPHVDMSWRRMMEGILMELSIYGRILPETVLELIHSRGPRWWHQFSICAPINHDGTVQWDKLNREHWSLHALYGLKGNFSSFELVHIDLGKYDESSGFRGIFLGRQH
jgi:hypothetical protein